MSEANKSICVLIADDHPVTRSGIRAILDRAPDIEVVGEARDGLEAERKVSELHPDVLLLAQVCSLMRSRSGCALTVQKLSLWC